MAPPDFELEQTFGQTSRVSGVVSGDTVMAHAALSRVGPMLNGPDALIGALLDATSPGGTVLAHTDWDARYDELLEPDGRVAAPAGPRSHRRSIWRLGI